MKPKTLITVLGPTAIGKTSLAIDLAVFYKTEILSSDSRQFYKEMKIGTAVPKDNELQMAKHHFIQHLSIHDNYSVGAFESQAIARLNELFSNKEVVIMAGGSGLYNKAVIEGLDNFPETDNTIREDLNNLLERSGMVALQSKLQVLDPEYYQLVDLNNPHRVIRALEICISSGKPFSSFLNQPKQDRDFNTLKIGLTAERQQIYDRINQRVDLMMADGLLEEAKSLFPYRHLNALQTVGYKELFEYFKGTVSLEFAVSEIKKNSRRFAKRQLTWMRKENDIHWFDYQTPHKEITDKISEFLSYDSL